MDETTKALANDIIEKCHQQELTYNQVWMLIAALQARYNDATNLVQKQISNTTAAELRYF